MKGSDITVMDDIRSLSPKDPTTITGEATEKGGEGGRGTGTDTPIESTGDEKVHTSEPAPTVQEYIDYSNDINTLITATQTIDQRLETLTNISILCMVGIGIIAGILSCNIFARYFTS